jgi:hypothetical protein
LTVDSEEEETTAVLEALQAAVDAAAFLQTDEDVMVFRTGDKAEGGVVFESENSPDWVVVVEGKV